MGQLYGDDANSAEVMEHAQPEPQSAETEEQQETEEITVEQALLRLKEMTAKRDLMTEAITKYKKYVQKLVGRM